ncbi:ATP-binding protein [Hymenobacter artigasi]|uniref:histidine kinase n=1 Tax=Hymenobacter artigasi TaxID=2719616 RepID=A0ABX1HID3_9BACT|nr:ATP-binding protein [Hymenobacter artigasi]NKI88766.1 signal transduction histidine kinase [Hymenobacter artigasi]
MAHSAGYGDLFYLAPMAYGIMRGLSRFLDLPQRLPRWHRALNYIWVPAAAFLVISVALRFKSPMLGDVYWLLVLFALLGVLLAVRHYRPARTLLFATAPFVVYKVLEIIIEDSDGKIPKSFDAFLDTTQGFVIIWLITFVFIARSQKKQLEKERVLREEEEKAKRLIEAQNVELERLVAERTAALTQQAQELSGALVELRTTQAQLVQSEKMASLGELTAGIAHEIQNPLNFVNNFADVSAELITELEEEKQKPDRDLDLEAELLADLKQNLLKISQHGGRAASIVRGMLEHSRTSSGERTPTNLNQLADEYLRLAYHGLRAKDKTFNATLKPDFDPALPPVEVIAQDLGRVLLNLLSNAFYAVRQRQQRGEAGYAPTVGISTRRVGEKVEIRVRDNGQGIPEAVRAKIFQPFFTTKPTGEGTGLGLSLSYDIVTQGHGGTLSLTSQEGSFTEFLISLPINQAG